MVGVSLLRRGKTKDFILGKLLLTGVKSVSAHIALISFGYDSCTLPSFHSIMILVDNCLYIQLFLRFNVIILWSYGYLITWLVITVLSHMIIQNRLVIWLLIDTLPSYEDKIFLVSKTLTLICAKNTYNE